MEERLIYIFIYEEFGFYYYGMDWNGERLIYIFMENLDFIIIDRKKQRQYCTILDRVTLA